MAESAWGQQPDCRPPPRVQVDNPPVSPPPLGALTSCRLDTKLLVSGLVSEAGRARTQDPRQHRSANQRVCEQSAQGGPCGTATWRLQPRRTERARPLRSNPTSGTSPWPRRESLVVPPCSGVGAQLELTQQAPPHWRIQRATAPNLGEHLPIARSWDFTASIVPHFRRVRLAGLGLP